MDVMLRIVQFRFGTCLHGYGEEVPEPELALVGGQLALGRLVADAVVL